MWRLWAFFSSGSRGAGSEAQYQMREARAVRRSARLDAAQPVIDALPGQEEERSSAILHLPSAFVEAWHHGIKILAI